MSRATINPMDLTGRHILVTGATGGIGYKTAQTLAQLGARILVTGRNDKNLRQVLDTLVSDGHASAQFDMANVDSIPKWVRQMAEQHGPFDGLAHCAGIQKTKPVRNADLAFFDETMHINLASAFALARGIRRKGNHGDKTSIVLVSSIAGVTGLPGNSVYAASKGGLLAATRAFAKEFVRDNIRVNAVVPGLINTEMANKSRTSMTAEQFEAMVAAQPLGLGEPDDVANAIAYLLSDASKWVTGSSLLVDGGCLCQ